MASAQTIVRPDASPAVAGNVRVTPAANATVTLPFIQTVELSNDAGNRLAHAIWFTNGRDGAIQLLHLEVEPAERRRGVGTKLFGMLKKEADLFFRSRGQRLRRVFLNAAHRDDIVFRGWLTKQGFHPTNTMTNVLKQQDAMIYLLGCD
jgi:GNAT superfamily N-acetyltransferase